MKSCPGCGASLQEGASFCEYCGAQVRTDHTRSLVGSGEESGG